MNSQSSLGPDGFPAVFCRDHWSVVGTDVIGDILVIVSTKVGFEEVNQTLITLIPKKQTPKIVFDYQPISLCNVFYKIIAKILANRLKVIISRNIFPTQSVFVPGILVSDNIIVL